MATLPLAWRLFLREHNFISCRPANRRSRGGRKSRRSVKRRSRDRVPISVRRSITKLDMPTVSTDVPRLDRRRCRWKLELICRLNSSLGMKFLMKQRTVTSILSSNLRKTVSCLTTSSIESQVTLSPRQLESCVIWCDGTLIMFHGMTGRQLYRMIDSTAPHDGNLSPPKLSENTPISNFFK